MPLIISRRPSLRSQGLPGTVHDYLLRTPRRRRSPVIDTIDQQVDADCGHVAGTGSPEDQGDNLGVSASRSAVPVNGTSPWSHQQRNHQSPAVPSVSILIPVQPASPPADQTTTCELGAAAATPQSSPFLMTNPHQENGQRQERVDRDANRQLHREPAPVIELDDHVPQFMNAPYADWEITRAQELLAEVEQEQQQEAEARGVEEMPPPSYDDVAGAVGGAPQDSAAGAETHAGTTMIRPEATCPLTTEAADVIQHLSTHDLVDYVRQRLRQRWDVLRPGANPYDNSPSVITAAARPRPTGGHDGLSRLQVENLAARHELQMVRDEARARQAAGTAGRAPGQLGAAAAWGRAPPARIPGQPLPPPHQPPETPHRPAHQLSHAAMASRPAAPPPRWQPAVQPHAAVDNQLLQQAPQQPLMGPPAAPQP